MSVLPFYIYHLAEEANLESIKRYGLRPAADLLSLAGFSAEEKRLFLQTQRKAHTVLPNGVHIRDQKPLPPEALSRCLVGLTPGEWYEMLNRRVFFWTDKERLTRQQKACAPRKQVVLSFETEKILAAYQEHVFVSPINTGFALRKPAGRGPGTFTPYEMWQKSGWQNEAASVGGTIRSAKHLPVEVTINRPLPDIWQFVTALT